VRAATRMAILSKLQDNEAIVIDDLKLTEGQTANGEPLVKTREMANVLKALKKAMTLDELSVPKAPGEELNSEQETDGKKKRAREMTLVRGRAGLDKKLHKAARNIAGVELLPAKEFNAYIVLKQKRLVLTRAALEELRQAGRKPAAAGQPS